MPVQSAASWTELDLDALRHNVGVLQRQASGADVAAVVKADAYGHGAIDIARAALDAGSASLCVFTVAEAVELREAGLSAPILCLGPVMPHEASLVAAHGISAVVDSESTADLLAETARTAGRRQPVQLNIDSGMQRYGLPHQQAIDLAATVRQRPALDLEAVFTHFPDATDRAASLDALHRFQITADAIGAPRRHAAASSAIFHLPEASLDMVRAGISLYGVDPAPERSSAASQLRPVLSWRTTILAVRNVAAGESVSYGGLWTAARDSRIGVAGVGYADGLPRALFDGGSMLVHGQRCPIRGAVCMDSTMIDLTHVPEASAGDAASIIGADASESITACEIARAVGTIPYEILTGISARVPRRVVGGDGGLVDKAGGS